MNDDKGRMAATVPPEWLLSLQREEVTTCRPSRVYVHNSSFSYVSFIFKRGSSEFIFNLAKLMLSLSAFYEATATVETRQQLQCVRKKYKIVLLFPRKAGNTCFSFVWMTCSFFFMKPVCPPTHTSSHALTLSPAVPQATHFGDLSEHLAVLSWKSTRDGMLRCREKHTSSLLVRHL